MCELSTYFLLEKISFPSNSNPTNILCLGKERVILHTPFFKIKTVKTNEKKKLGKFMSCDINILALHILPHVLSCPNKLSRDYILRDLCILLVLNYS